MMTSLQKVRVQRGATLESTHGFRSSVPFIRFAHSPSPNPRTHQPPSFRLIPIREADDTHVLETRDKSEREWSSVSAEE